MIRNIPNAYTQNDLVIRLDSIIRGMYDFVYLPIDFVVSLKNSEIFKIDFLHHKHSDLTSD